MRRLTTALCVAYALAALALLRCAMTSQQHGAREYAALFASCSALLGLAIVHHAYHRDELRTARAQLERATRPADPVTRAHRDDIVLGWADLEDACCLRAWESRGTAHDPRHCTRTDQTA